MSGHPQSVRPIGSELALDQIGRGALSFIAPGRDDEAATPADATDAVGAHQSSTRLPLTGTH
jgi:hypothetical protein